VRTVFVCGPFTEAMNGDGLDHGLRDFLEMIHKTLLAEDMRIFSAHKHERWGGKVPPHNKVAKRDFKWMKTCDATVIVLGSPWQSSWRTDGTFIELGWATWREIPVVVVGDLDAYRSPLVRGLPGALANVHTLTPVEVLADPAILVRTLQQALRPRSTMPVAEQTQPGDAFSPEPPATGPVPRMAAF
jgi:nucleoside 2-deoxyribosyltransferase